MLFLIGLIHLKDITYFMLYSFLIFFIAELINASSEIERCLPHESALKDLQSSWCSVCVENLELHYPRVLSDELHYPRVLSDELHYPRVLSDELHYHRVLSDELHYPRVLSDVLMKKPSWFCSAQRENNTRGRAIVARLSKLNEIPNFLSSSLHWLVCVSDVRKNK